MRILRMLTVKNEMDILGRNIDWYASKGIPSVVIDNGSSDGSYELMKGMSVDEVAACARLPTEGYDEKRLLSAVHQLAISCFPDWLLLADADEFYESPIPGETIKQGLERVAREGYNIIRFHNMEFWMTEKDDSTVADPLERIRHYSYFDSNRYKAYPAIEGLDISAKLGHAPVFPQKYPVNLCPETFISRHYKFRSLTQGYRKIVQVAPTKESPDQNFHYRKFGCDPRFFIVPSEKLKRYDNDKKWVVERTFDGGRMTREEMMRYLKLETTGQLDAWFRNRSL